MQPESIFFSLLEPLATRLVLLCFVSKEPCEGLYFLRNLVQNFTGARRALRQLAADYHRDLVADRGQWIALEGI
jgi:hypothetical protein